MSNKNVQQAVLAELCQHQGPISIRELVVRVREARPEFRGVADFDIRSAVLAMTALGAIESNSTNQISIRPGSGLAACG